MSPIGRMYLACQMTFDITYLTVMIYLTSN